MMDKEEILQKNKKRFPVGEMEQSKLNKGNWISLIIAGVVAITMMIVEGALGHYSSIFAISSICYVWASLFYGFQYFMAKRPWPVLFGFILHGLAAITMIVLYIVSNVCSWW